MWAVDAAKVAEPLELRPEAEGGRWSSPSAAGPVAPLSAAPEDGDVAPDRRTRGAAALRVQVPNVPDLYVEEALWTCVELLE